MRILVLVPSVTTERTINRLREFLPSDVDVVGLREAHGGGALERKSDMAFTLREELEAIVEAERQGYDAVVLECHADPGVQEVRELVDIPVIGPTMVALHISFMLGYRVCILKPTMVGRLMTQQNIRLYGFDNRAVVRGSNLPIEEAIANYDEYKASGSKITPFITDMLTECVKAIEEDKCDVITFGCGGIIWMKEVIQSELAKKGYTPTVVNPLPTAVEVARVFVNLRLTHSRITYPKNVRLLTSLTK